MDSSIKDDISNFVSDDMTIEEIQNIINGTANTNDKSIVYPQQIPIVQTRSRTKRIKRKIPTLIQHNIEDTQMEVDNDNIINDNIIHDNIMHDNIINDNVINDIVDNIDTLDDTETLLNLIREQERYEHIMEKQKQIIRTDDFTIRMRNKPPAIQMYAKKMSTWDKIYINKDKLLNSTYCIAPKACFERFVDAICNTGVGDEVCVYKIRNMMTNKCIYLVPYEHDISLDDDRDTHFFIPNDIMIENNINENDELCVSLCNLQPCTELTLKIYDEKFDDIKDVKEFLEEGIKYKYPVLSNEQHILLIYRHDDIYIELKCIIEDLKPNKHVRTVNTNININLNLTYIQQKQERLEKERLEKERLENERLEKERLEKEKKIPTREELRKLRKDFFKY